MADNQKTFWQHETFGKDETQIGFFGNSGIIVPSGTSIQRPAGVLGQLRYNTDLSRFEGFFGVSWLDISSGGGGGTFISLIDTPGTMVGAGNQTLRVNTAANALEFTSSLSLSNDGTILAGTASYETLVITDNVLSNKKYVNDQDNLRLLLAGGTMTGILNSGGFQLVGLPLIPTASNEAVSKFYADSIAGGMDPKTSCRLATTIDLNTETSDTWVAAGSGVGKTLTSGNISVTIDSLIVANGDRILIKNEGTGLGNSHNGIHTVSGVGVNVVLTRATDQDGSPASEVSGGNFTFIEQGVANNGEGYVVVANGDVAIDVDPMIWSIFTAGKVAFLPLAGGIMTGSITMSGSAQFEGDPTLSNTTPSYAFATDLDTGMFRVGVDTLGFATNALSRWEISATGELLPVGNALLDIGTAGRKIKDTYSSRVLTNAGTVGAPSYTFEGTATTGIYSNTTNEISVAISGANAFTFEADGTLSAQTASYETLVTTDQDIPNKKYVDDSDTGSIFLLQPGGTADADKGIYTTWATLFTFLATRSTLSIVELDDTVSSPISVLSGTYNVSNVIFKVAPATGVAVVSVSLATGVVFSGAQFTSEGNILWTNVGTGAIMTGTAGNMKASLTESSVLCTGTGSFFTVSGTTTFILDLFRGSALVGATTPALDVTATTPLISIVIHDGSRVLNDSIKSVAAVTTLNVTKKSASSFYDANQAGSLTIPTVFLVAEAANIIYDPSVSTLTATETQAAIDELDTKVSGSAIQIIDADGDTKIQVEEAVDEDIIRFDVGATTDTAIPNVMTLAANGLFVDFLGGATNSGAPISLVTGDSSGTLAGNGGNMTLTAGQGIVSGNGGNIAISSGASGGDVGDLGGDITLTAGDAANAILVGTPGDIALVAGGVAGGSSGPGGNITIAGGLSGVTGTSGAGGAVTITGGASGATSIGGGGAVNITGGAAGTGSAGDGGDIVLTGGANDGVGIPGTILMASQTRLASGTAAVPSLVHDTQLATGINFAGDNTIRVVVGGVTKTTTDSVEMDFDIPISSNAATGLEIRTTIGFDDVDGGDINILAGNGGPLVVNLAQNGGSIRLEAGQATGTGNDGAVVIGSSGALSGELRLEDNTGGEYVALRANAVTTTHNLTLPAANATGRLENDGNGVLTWTNQLKYTETTASATVHIITHNLGTEDVIVSVYDASTPRNYIIPTTIALTSINVVTITLASAGIIRVVILG